MPVINHKECKYAGYSEEGIKKITSIARRISRAVKEASELDIEIFGGSTSGTLRASTFDKDGIAAGIVLATLDGQNWNGGDGGTGNFDEYERGE